MFTSNFFQHREWADAHREMRPDCNPYALIDAEHLFESAFQETRWLRIWHWICGQRGAALWDLDEVKAQVKVTNRHYRGVREVKLSDIQGTLGRSGDFDRDFHPLHDRVRQRWINVAAASFQGMGLPAVDLVKVGAVYFVIDGHHRISVARAMHKHEIDAVVIEWKVTGTLPWEREPSAAEGKPAFAA